MNLDLLEHILDISRHMAETRSLTPLLNYVTDQAIQLVGAEQGFVVLVQPSGELDFRVKRGQHGEELDQAEDQVSQSVLNQVISTGEALILRDAMNDPHFGIAQSVLGLKLRSIMCVPLISGGDTLGAIYVENRSIRSRFNKDDLAPLVLFANQAAVAIENAAINDDLRSRAAELNRAYQRLERLDKTKSDFITVAAHELRTPLTLIRGYTQLLKEQIKDVPKTITLLEGILTGQRRLHEIVNSMLDVTKIDSQVLDVRYEPTNILQIIESVQDEFALELQERQLTLTVSDLDNLPTIQADPDLLFKVFYHLIVNAIKYTPDGGSIAVSGELVSQIEKDPMVHIIVSDTGIGIDPAHHELIFEKFYQTGQVALHSTGRTKFKGGGPGLGLAIAHGIVQAHNGRIWVSSPGYDEETCPGSHFHILLPFWP